MEAMVVIAQEKDIETLTFWFSVHYFMMLLKIQALPMKQ